MSNESLVEARKKFEKEIGWNVVDKLVSRLSPSLGLKRMAVRSQQALSAGYMGSGYDGASMTRGPFKNWNVSEQSADSALIPALSTLRKRSHDMVRNNPLAHGIIKNNRTKIIGRGLRFQSNPDRVALGLTEEQAQELKYNIERYFNAWAESKDSDIKRISNFYQQQGLALPAAMISGDCFALTPMKEVEGFPFKTRFQLIESERVCNKGHVRDTSDRIAGIHIDQFGAPTAVDILNQHPAPLIRKGDTWQTVKVHGVYGRRNVIHLCERTRIAQTRGEPYLAPVIESLKQLGKYTEAELTAAVVSALFTVFIQNGTSQGGPVGGLLDGVETTDPNTLRKTYELGAGAIINGVEGDEVKTINPGRPNALFDPFVQSILRQIGVALELPFEVLIKHFTASYSAARSALMEAWKFYMNRRYWMAVDFCQPTLEAVMMECVATKKINMPGFFKDPLIKRAYLRGTWHGDGPGSIDPYKEAQGIEKRLNIGLSTLDEEIANYNGSSFEQTHAQRSKEVRQRKADGLMDADAPAAITAPVVEPDSDKEDLEDETK